MNYPINQLIQTPKGGWIFVGRTFVRLCYTQIDGQPLTDEQCGNIIHVGPGLYLGDTIRAISYKTKQAAIDAANELDVEYSL
jgi:hypothetical protein